MLFYRALLRLYPKSFRAEYGAEMMKDFLKEWREASTAAKAMLAGPGGRRHRGQCGACARRHHQTGSPLRDSLAAAHAWIHAHRDPRRARSASAPPPRRSRSPITCCCGRCRSPTPTASSGSGKITPRSDIRAWNRRRRTSSTGSAWPRCSSGSNPSPAARPAWWATASRNRSSARPSAAEYFRSSGDQRRSDECSRKPTSTPPKANGRS